MRFLSALNPVPLIAAGTRRLQAMQPRHAVKGLTRFGNLLDRWLPSYAGVVRLPDGTCLALDSRQPAERWLLFSGNYHPAVTHLLRQHTPAGGGCLDVGANLGFYTLKFARWVGPAGRVAAFEANPVMLDRIRRNVALNGFAHVDVVDQPIHRQAEPVTFHVSASPGKSSIHAWQVADPVQTLHLTTTTIDAYLNTQNWPRLDVIKLDIEGNDCNALLGASDSLARFHPFIIFEYWCSTPADVADEAFSLLDGLSYKLFSLRRDGRPVPFDRRARQDTHHHSDIMALPG